MHKNMHALNKSSPVEIDSEMPGCGLWQCPAAVYLIGTDMPIKILDMKAIWTWRIHLTDTLTIVISSKKCDREL